MVTAKTVQQAIVDIGNAKIFSRIRQADDEEAWEKVRGNGVGGSDVGSICGVNRYRTPRQVYYDKTGQHTTEREPNEASVEIMHFGHMLEPVVADEFEKRHAADGFICVEADCTFQSTAPGEEFLLGNVDRLVWKYDRLAGILECKTASAAMREEWERGDVPMTYIYQVQHYMHVTGLHHAWIACICGGNKYYEYPITYDDDLYANEILPKLDFFWNECVMKGVEPGVLASDDEVMDAIYQKDAGAESRMALDNTFDDVASRLEDLKAAKKSIDNEIKQLNAQIKDTLGECRYGDSTSYIFDWAPRQRTSVDTTLLKENYPDVYQECVKVTNYRNLRIKRLDEEE